MTAIRPAQPADAPALARLLRVSRRDSMPWLPDLHTPEEDLAFIAAHVLPACRVWVAEQGGEPVGFLALRGAARIEHLYLRPDRLRRGIGTCLLDLAKRHSGGRLDLWVFQRNAAARAFYERHGFRAAEFTSGAANEEREPDLRYEWSADEPAATSPVV